MIISLKILDTFCQDDWIDAELFPHWTLLIFTFDYVYVFIYESVSLYIRVQRPWRPENTTGPPWDRVTSHCEPPDVGTGNQTQILCRTPTTLKHWGISTDPTLNFIFKVLLWCSVVVMATFEVLLGSTGIRSQFSNNVISDYYVTYHLFGKLLCISIALNIFSVTHPA